MKRIDELFNYRSENDQNNIINAFVLVISSNILDIDFTQKVVKSGKYITSCYYSLSSTSMIGHTLCDIGTTYIFLNRIL